MVHYIILGTYMEDDKPQCDILLATDDADYALKRLIHIEEMLGYDRIWLESY